MNGFSAENMLYKQLIAANKEKKGILLHHFSQLHALQINEIRDRRHASQLKCPHCNHTGTSSSYGFYDADKSRRRFYCKACNTHFNDLTGTLFYNRKLQHHIIPFLQMMLDGKSIRKIAEELCISPTTVHKWRHLVLQYVEQYMSSYLADINNQEVLTETSVREFNPSRKGLQDRKRIQPLTLNIRFHYNRLGQMYIAIDYLNKLKTKKQLIQGHTYLSLNNVPIPQSGLSLVDQRLLYHSKNAEKFHHKFDVMHKRMRGVAQPYLKKYLLWHWFLEINQKLTVKERLKTLMFTCI